jgi:hypothetical protein
MHMPLHIATLVTTWCAKKFKYTRKKVWHNRGSNPRGRRAYTVARAIPTVLDRLATKSAPRIKYPFR